MSTKMVKIKQRGMVYEAPIKGYYVYSAGYLVATKPPIDDLLGILILQSDGTMGMILASECLNYDELPDNLLHFNTINKKATAMKVISDKEVNKILENTSRIQRQIEMINKSIPVQSRLEIIDALAKEIEAIFKEPTKSNNTAF